MATYAPPQAVDGPPREALPFGLFSTFSFRPPTVMERWENGVEWEAISCDPAYVLEPDCEDPPSNSYTTCLRGEAAGFLVVSGQRSGLPGGRADLRTEEQAVARLLATEEVSVEGQIWSALVATPVPDIDDLTATDLHDALAQAEQYMADTYGSRGTIHMSRRAASLLGGDKVTPSGSRLLTLLGTPVAAGGGYGSDDPLKIMVSPPVFGYRGAVQTVNLIDPKTNDAYSLAQRAYTIGWDPCPIASITIDTP
jgi:hypothetical protein